jgi:hypothetical protein
MKSEHDELMNHLTNGSFILVDRDDISLRAIRSVAWSSSLGHTKSTARVS